VKDKTVEILLGTMAVNLPYLALKNAGIEIKPKRSGAS